MGAKIERIDSQTIPSAQIGTTKPAIYGGLCS